MQKGGIPSILGINYTPSEDSVPSLGQRRRRCHSCGGGIFDGEFYYMISGDPYCEDCIRCFDTAELADAFGYPEISYLIGVLGGNYRRD